MSFKVSVIFAGSSDVSKQFQKPTVEENSSIRQVLGQCGIPTDNVHVNLDGVSTSLDSPVGPNSRITVTATNLKGAVVSFDEILAWGTGKGVVADNVLEQAMAELAEEGAKAHKQIVKELVEVMQDEANCANSALIAAKKALAAAEENVAELAYASEQLKEGNIFSLLGYAGLKGEARHYCNRMGCEVPAANSQVWATSPPKAEK